MKNMIFLGFEEFLCMRSCASILNCPKVSFIYLPYPFFADGMSWQKGFIINANIHPHATIRKNIKARITI